jgi:hypothetical protein
MGGNRQPDSRDDVSEICGEMLGASSVSKNLCHQQSKLDRPSDKRDPRSATGHPGADHEIP